MIGTIFLLEIFLILGSDFIPFLGPDPVAVFAAGQSDLALQRFSEKLPTLYLDSASGTIQTQR